MKKKHFQKIRWTMILAAAAFTVSSIYPIKAFAIESFTLPVEIVGDDVVSISLPAISESEISVFDFILDPQGLLYRTDAARYGGGRVEEDATLLFYNKEGEYDFSKHSDWLTVTNQSTVPVQVTVMAQVMELGDISLAESDDFGESTEHEVYLAIEDDKGNIMPLPADGQAVIDLEMSAAPEYTYAFRLNEETHTYQYRMSMDSGMVDFDTYSFRLVGACNSNAEWQNISVHPAITVTWSVEPIIPKEQEEISEEAFAEEKNETTTDDGIEDVPVDENSEDDASGDLDDEGKSYDEFDEKKDEGNASGGLDDENQSDDESDKENREDDVNGDLEDKDQSHNESSDENDNKNLNGNKQNEGVEGKATE